MTYNMFSNGKKNNRFLKENKNICILLGRRERSYQICTRRHFYKLVQEEVILAELGLGDWRQLERLKA